MQMLGFKDLSLYKFPMVLGLALPTSTMVLYYSTSNGQHQIFGYYWKS